MWSQRSGKCGRSIKRSCLIKQNDHYACLHVHSNGHAYNTVCDKGVEDGDRVHRRRVDCGETETE